MTDDSGPNQFQFEDFCLIPGERILLRNGARVALGSRALDILIVLASRAGELVAKQELIAAVWPNVRVEEVCLRVHVAALRKALGGGKGQASYIANISGRGYCFVGRVRKHAGAPRPQDHAFPNGCRNRGALSLPSVVGRESSIAAIEAKLLATRFVTITGAGGIGKTTIASALVERIGAKFGGGSYWVDLGSLTDGTRIEDLLARQLGLTPGWDALSAALAWLRGRHALLVFDNCQHGTRALAPLSEWIARAAPLVHLLATSREPLGSCYEHIYHVPPLEVPPHGNGLSARDALRYPAVQFFVERIQASGFPFQISDADVPVIASICRRLDGSPLALESAAGRFGSDGSMQADFRRLQR